jgi:hypothetical protein
MEPTVYWQHSTHLTTDFVPGHTAVRGIPQENGAVRGKRDRYAGVELPWAGSTPPESSQWEPRVIEQNQ